MRLFFGFLRSHFLSIERRKSKVNSKYLFLGYGLPTYHQHPMKVPTSFVKQFLFLYQFCKKDFEIRSNGCICHFNTLNYIRLQWWLHGGLLKSIKNTWGPKSLAPFHLLLVSTNPNGFIR